MTKNELCQAAARRLGLTSARVNGCLQVLHAAGIVRPIRGTRRYPDDVHPADAIALILATMSPAPVSAAAAAAATLAATKSGAQTLRDFLLGLLLGEPRHLQHLIVGQTGASIVVDRQHLVFGAAPAAGARIYRGDQITALAAELQGMPPAQADAVAALSGIIS